MRVGLRPTREYLRLGSDASERTRAYRELAIRSAGILHLVRKAAHYCQPVDDERFRAQIESRYGVKLGQAKRGRLAAREDEGRD